MALCAGTDVPAWVVSAMAELPDTMIESGRRANQYENAVVDLCEAELLQGRVGETFAAVVVEVDEKDAAKGDVTIQDPAIEARVTGSADLPLGDEVSVVLVEADPDDAQGGVRAGVVGVRPPARRTTTTPGRRGLQAGTAAGWATSGRPTLRDSSASTQRT